MKNNINLVIGLLLVACFITKQAFAQEDCFTPDGLASVVADENIKYLVFGENHGSVEAPGLFANSVCSLVKSGKRVLVGLELPQGDTQAYEQFLRSTGGPDDVSKLLAASYWSKDGRGSMAMLNLIQRMQTLVADGHELAISTFAPDDIAPGTPYERGMASSLMGSQASGSYDLVMVLVGNIHAFKLAIPGDPPMEPMAMHLPKNTTKSLRMVSDGGTSWNCRGADCGVHSSAASPIVTASVIELRSDIGPGYDGVFYTGPVTASPPAKGVQ